MHKIHFVVQITFTIYFFFFFSIGVVFWFLYTLSQVTDIPV